MTAKDYRAIARQKLAGKWGTAILIALVAFYLGGLLVNGNVEFKFRVDEDTEYRISSILYLPITFLGLGGILSIAQFIIGGVVRQGYAVSLLKQYDGEETSVKDLFCQFHRFGDGFCLMLLEGLFVILWMLLFIIPGIVASYRYAMAPFIMAENEDMTASEAIKASKEMMDGHKAELFFLDLSFIGWNLLNLLTLGIGSIALNPYMNAARAAFYRNLVPKALPQPTIEYIPEHTEE
jgi:uncharacterized membrane protein